MKPHGTLLTGLILLACILELSCAIPRMVWPQRDISTSELDASSAKQRVLVASRSSEFKDAVISRIRAAFGDGSVYVKFIGLDDLEDEDGETYDAVVLINMCIAWGLDPAVSGFIKRHERHSRIIVLTTSGDGKWAPDKHGRDYDAISAASKQAEVDTVAEEIITKVRLLLEQP